MAPRGLGTLETRVDLVYRGQEHRNELVTRVVLSLAQGVGETQRRNTRHVGAGHRRSLHVAIVRTGQLRAGGREDTGAFAAREADGLTAGSCNVATLAVAGVVGRQAVGADRRYRDALAVSAREVRDVLRLVSGRVDGQTAVQGCTVVLCHEVEQSLDLQRRVLFVLTVGGEVGRGTVRALEDRCSVVGCILDGPADNLVRRVGHTREYLARHQAYAVAVARTSGHSGYADTVVVHGGDGSGHVRAMARVSVYLTVGQFLQLVPRNRAVIGKVIAVDVLIAVLLAGLGVGPHVGRQVGVRVLHALVHDSTMTWLLPPVSFHASATLMSAPATASVAMAWSALLM